MNFTSAAALSAQIRQDVDSAAAIFRELNRAN
jgi:hypothetical protein